MKGIVVNKEQILKGLHKIYLDKDNKLLEKELKTIKSKERQAEVIHLYFEIKKGATKIFSEA